jgi:DNA mismatch endonuclease (patch repair protein)
MVDRLSPERRSWNMGRIRGRDTGPERIVRSELHRLGLRFRLHARGLPGRPDIVMPRWKTVVFVHGCFWHRHKSCRYAYTPKSRVDFWSSKFRDTIARDRRLTAKLEQSGWRVIVIWECDTFDREELGRTLARLFRTPR